MKASLYGLRVNPRFCVGCDKRPVRLNPRAPAGHQNPHKLYYERRHTMPAIGRPGKDEAASYYSTYIDRVTTADVNAYLIQQRDESVKLLSTITEDKSLYKYDPATWSIREMLNHLNDTERIFTHSALWFGRGLPASLPSFDQNIAAPAAAADQISWSAQ